MNHSTFLVRVPATSANLGPGFDCLGLALALHNTVKVRPGEKGLALDIAGEGAALLAHDDQNLVVMAAARLFREAGQELPPLHFDCDNGIPLASGLGSSAAAVAAGLCCANGLLGNAFSAEQLIEFGARLEGHADNVAACILGGLVVIRRDPEGIRTVAYPMPAQTVVAIVPELELPTTAMREILPQQVSMEAAVHNAASLPLLLEALRRDDHEMLAYAARDRLHEPYRLSQIPGAAESKQAGLDAGASAVVLSGAGPGLLAFAPSGHEEIARAMVDAFEKEGLAARRFVLAVENSGASTTRLEGEAG